MLANDAEGRAIVVILHFHQRLRRVVPILSEMTHILIIDMKRVVPPYHIYGPAPLRDNI